MIVIRSGNIKVKFTVPFPLSTYSKYAVEHAVNMVCDGIPIVYKTPKIVIDESGKARATVEDEQICGKLTGPGKILGEKDGALEVEFEGILSSAGTNSLILNRYEDNITQFNILSLGFDGLIDVNELLMSNDQDYL